jgi:hypothetical protein
MEGVVKELLCILLRDHLPYRSGEQGNHEQRQHDHKEEAVA